MKKEQQQVVLLGVILAVIFGALMYMYRDRLLPAPQGAAPVPPAPPRLTLPSVEEGGLFEREDYKQLRRFGDVPVKALPDRGTPDPFAAQ